MVYEINVRDYDKTIRMFKNDLRLSEGDNLDAQMAMPTKPVSTAAIPATAEISEK